MAGKKQEISVPFCWEEVPGTPKRNWNKTTTTKTYINEPPIKLLLPLPLPPSSFFWEEVPGTPKRNWNKTTTTKTSINEPPIKLLLPLPPSAAAKSTVSIPFKWEEKPGTPLPFFSQHHQSSSSSYDQDESESPVSQFSDSDSDCYESGGEEGLIEWMFPLSSTTHSSYLEKAGCHEKGVQKDGGMNEGKVFDEMKYSTTMEIKRPLLTLGEMIMMSKRRSYQKKTMDMHSQSFTKETKKRKAFLSCIKGLMDIILSKPHMNWSKQQKRKLM